MLEKDKGGKAITAAKSNPEMKIMGGAEIGPLRGYQTHGTHGHKSPHGYTGTSPPTGTRAHEHTPSLHGHTGREVIGQPIMIYGK